MWWRFYGCKGIIIPPEKEEKHKVGVNMKKRTSEEETARAIRKLREAAEEKKKRMEESIIQKEKRPVILEKEKRRGPDQEYMTTWGNKILDDGFTMIPNTLLENYTKIGLNHTDMAVITAILRFAYHGKRPFPSQKTITNITGLSERTIRDTINKIMIKGYLTVQKRYIKGEGNEIRRTSNLYNFTGLYKKVEDIKKEE